MKASERRQEIFDILCEDRHATMDCLANQFNVSRRTIVNDVRELSLIYPIYTVCGKYDGGVYLSDNFKLGNCPEVETIVGARGGEYQEDGKGKIQIHAVRMPGFVASQQVILGADGQVLKIHHDTINRECYMSGVALAVKHVYQNNQFIYGLENIL